MVQNWSKCVPIWSKWNEIDQNWSKIHQNLSKFIKIDKNSPRLMKCDHYWSKWSKIDLEWFKFDQNGTKCIQKFKIDLEWFKKVQNWPWLVQNQPIFGRNIEFLHQSMSGCITKNVMKLTKWSHEMTKYVYDTWKYELKKRVLVNDIHYTSNTLIGMKQITLKTHNN